MIGDYFTKLLELTLFFRHMDKIMNLKDLSKYTYV